MLKCLTVAHLVCPPTIAQRTTDYELFVDDGSHEDRNNELEAIHESTILIAEKIIGYWEG